MPSWFGSAADGVIEVGDTAYDVAFSGHEHDEIDILGPSANLPTGKENPDTTFAEDEIPVYDPETGEYLGYTNTENLPVGGDDEGEEAQSSSASSQVLFYVAVALAVAYGVSQV